MKDKIQTYKIYNLDIDKSFKRFFSYLESINENIDYKEILPDYYLDDFISNIKTIDEKLSILDKNINFIDKYTEYKDLFSKIEKASIDNLALKALTLLETNKSILGNLKTFNSKNIKKIEYDTFSNTSGRLIVKSGPNILTLPKRCRGIFKSSFDQGELISVDFNNLEPRLALKLLDKNVEGDIYEGIKDILELDVDRSIIKRAIISILYGSNFISFKNLSKERTDVVVNSIKSFFELEKLLKISINLDQNNIRRNYFGRPLWNLEEEKENILINNYIQSSAVDLALTYFSELVGKIDLSYCKPIFLIHDAIVFDVSLNYKENLKNIVKEGFNEKNLGNFPVSMSIFNITQNDKETTNEY